MSSNVLFCQQSKHILFTVLGEYKIMKLFTFTQVESENLGLYFFYTLLKTISCQLFSKSMNRCSSGCEPHTLI